MVEAWRGGVFILLFGHIQIWGDLGVVDLPALKPAIAKGTGNTYRANGVQPISILHNKKFWGLKTYFIKT